MSYSPSEDDYPESGEAVAEYGRESRHKEQQQQQKAATPLPQGNNSTSPDGIDSPARPDYQKQAAPSRPLNLHPRPDLDKASVLSPSHRPNNFPSSDHQIPNQSDSKQQTNYGNEHKQPKEPKAAVLRPPKQDPPAAAPKVKPPPQPPTPTPKMYPPPQTPTSAYKPEPPADPKVKPPPQPPTPASKPELLLLRHCTHRLNHKLQILKQSLLQLQQCTHHRNHQLQRLNWSLLLLQKFTHRSHLNKILKIRKLTVSRCLGYKVHQGHLRQHHMRRRAIPRNKLQICHHNRIRNKLRLKFIHDRILRRRSLAVPVVALYENPINHF